MVVNPEHHFDGESKPNNNVHSSISDLSPDQWQDETVVILNLESVLSSPS